jgi:hypothetical protein
MALSSEAARQIEQDLLTKADVLAHYLSGLEMTDAERAKGVLAEILTRLEQAISLETGPDAKSDRSRSSERRSPVLVASRSVGAEDIEEFILENLANSPRGLSVQEIVDYFEEAAIEIKRPTLVVRLHRLERAGKLTSRTHGHYVLSEAEYSRRQSA